MEKLESIITARQQSCGKVMFSFVSVCLQAWGPIVTIKHDALDLTIQGPPWTRDLTIQGPQPSLNMGPHCTGASLPAYDIWWPQLETCSNLFT